MNMILLATEAESELEKSAQKFAENPGIVMKWLQNSIPNVLSFLVQVLIALLVLWIGSKIIKGVMKVAQKAMDRGKLDISVTRFLGQIIKYALYAVLIMIILSMFGVATGSVVAVLGSAGLTVGLALQGSLSNFAGGVLILVLKPFVIGDYIIESASGKEGTVSETSIFYTSLITVDNKVVMIPNGALANATITNVSRMNKRRVDLKVGVSYSSDLAMVKAALYDVANREEKILTGEPVDVFVDELADSAVVVALRVWVNSSDYFTTKWRMTEEIKKTFDEKGIQIPFPQLDVQIKQ